MAEAFAAIGIAASIAQLTDYSISLFAGAREYYKSASEAKKELEEVIQDIKDLSEGIIAASYPTSLTGSLSPDEEKLLKLAEEISNGDPFRKLSSLRQAIRSVRQKKEIEDLELRLHRIQDQRMLHNLKYYKQPAESKNDDAHASLHSAIERFSETNERNMSHTTIMLKQLRSDILQGAERQDMAVEDLSTRVSALAKEARKLALEQKILESLCYESMNQRHPNIKRAHKETLRWAFDKPEIRLLNWLKSDILLDILERSADQKVLPAGFCFFINGLDEYDGCGDEINRFLQKLIKSKKSKSIKLCVFSRPWTAFVRAFGKSDQKLQVENLTVNDMKRLDEFPPELEEYFRTTLRRIDPIYRKETAEIFLLTVEAVRPVPVYALMFLDSERQDSEYALKVDIKSVTETEGDGTCMTWRNRLNNRCKDLLEVKVHNDSNFSGPIHFLRYKDDFLHRAALLVSDFRSARMLKQLNPLFGIVDEFMYYAREFDHYHRVLLETGQCASLGDNALRSKSPHCHGSIGNSPLSDTDLRIERFNALLDELDRVNSEYARKERNHWKNARDAPKETDVPFKEYGQNTFLSLAIQANL
ncbi:hypothetical protein BDD12DRAFT_800766 [Trichophaea hybrida]|nr:hypothetical protein BDD12DRAFT_800766 [Trichophaea hybrida]